MEFASANPSVIRSIKQRILLNAWLRMPRRPERMPAIVDFQPEAMADELADMMGFNVEGEGDGARFLITQEGTRLAVTYGNDDPAQRTNRYLDDAIGPDRYARVAPYYRTLLARKRPTYSIATVQDAARKFLTNGCYCRLEALKMSNRSLASTRQSASKGISGSII